MHHICIKYIIYVRPDEPMNYHIWELKIFEAANMLFLQMFWDLDELHMVRHSPVYDEAIQQKEQVRKQFSAAKPVCALSHSLKLIYFFGLISLITVCPFSYARLLNVFHISLEKSNWRISCMLLHWVCIRL